MVLFVHNRYRTTGGEERAVTRLLALVREQLGERAELLTRDSSETGRAAAAVGLLRGGVAADEVARALRSSGARVLHAHNLLPLFGWRALAAAKREGVRVVVHLHQYRLVCANGVCFTAGRECVRCHGRNTLPGVLHNCRGSRPEALAYAASLALWQRRIGELADAVIVPSAFARERLRALAAPLPDERVHVLAPPIALPQRAAAVDTGGYALVTSRLAREKGIDVAIEACALAGVPLVIAGDGPERDALRALAAVRDTAVRDTAARETAARETTSPATAARNAAAPETGARESGAHARGSVRFVGEIAEGELARLRAGAAVALVPSRSAETFGLAAAEAMAAGLPVIASRVGALPELVGAEGLVDPGEPRALADAIRRLWRDRDAGTHARDRVRMTCSPEMIATRLRALYE